MIDCLYVHIPFVARPEDRGDAYAVTCHDAAARRYVTAVLREADSNRGVLAPTVLYLGGGDPTALSAAHLRALCSGLLPRGGSAPVAEWSVEAGLATLDPDKLAVLVSCGVTRLCLRVTAPDPTGASSALQQAVTAGFHSVAADLYMDPSEERSSAWMATLREVVAAGAQHVSTYSAEPESSPSAHERWRARLEQADLALREAGYHRYEIWSYARPGFECAYTLACWRGEDYLGLGPAASSHVGLKRWTHTADLDRYVRAVEAGLPPPQTGETLTPAQKAREAVMFGLYLSEGVDPEAIARRVARRFSPAASPPASKGWKDGAEIFQGLEEKGDDFPTLGKTAAPFSNDWKKLVAVFQALERDGMVSRHGARWALTDRGRYLADHILRRLLWESGTPD